ncbi:fatty acid desaturase family protein [Ferrovibrio sp.]|uniref:fatty acid desaturase family protein n=1 Tax=Ferrovibrio sp. TaxID=1917215 RepID=UPI0025B80C64|nr:fatty acid desaturase family protein [Ferrovibrio sp.]
MSSTARTVFTPDEIRTLSQRSDWMGAYLVLHAWALIAGAMALFVWLPNPLTFLLAVMVIGGRQLGLAILMHDAAHGLLFRTRRLNEFAGQWLCAFPVGTDLHLYRPYHLKHHRHTQQADDPDLVLSAPFPINRTSLKRKIWRDITGNTGVTRRKQQIMMTWGAEPGLSWRERYARLKEGGLVGFVITNALMLAAMSAVGLWWLWPVLWLLPLLTWYQLVSRIRNIAEHAVVPDNDDPLRNTRTTYANPIARLLLAPYWVNYHLEHHLLLSLPCWKLPAAHRVLMGKGLRDQMELRGGYREVLRMAASAVGDNGGGSGGAKPAHI